MSGNSDGVGIIVGLIIFAIIGALLGYWDYGDFQHTCIGAAVGMIMFIVLMVLCSD